MGNTINIVLSDRKRRPHSRRPHSEETKQKISRAKMGKKMPSITGSKHPMWRGGVHRDKGYILIKNREHQYTNSRGYVFEHRLIMEKHLGRYLRPDEVVHHIDGNRSNNDINNLIVLSQSEHHKLTNKQLWKNNRGSGDYVRVYKSDHPNRDHNNCVKEHRLVVEQHVGRYLRHDEIVHHINGIKSDNRLENLQLMTKSEHHKLHMRINNGS